MVRLGFVGGITPNRMRPLLLVFALAAAGCSSAGNEAADLMPGGESGYRWIGQGEKGNFASSYGFCRQNIEYQNFGGPNSSIERPGGGTVIFNTPSPGISGYPATAGYANRRSFDSCMRSQGWASADQAAPASPAPSPAPPAAGSPPKD